MLLALFVVFCSHLVSQAQNYDFVYKGIYYKITGTNTVCTVMHSNHQKLSGTLTIPESVPYKEKDYSVTKIGISSFSNCKNITSVVLPTTVTSIEDNAFIFCSAISEIALPNSIKKIGSDAFSGCAITSMEVPNSVTALYSGAFSHCRALQSITLPITLTKISRNLFQGCSSLTSITIPSSVTTIEPEAFSGCISLHSVDFLESITEIGDDAFYGCTGLIEIPLSNQLKSIGDGAFSGCIGITSIVIPSVIESIGKRAFSGCSNLSEIVFPETDFDIGTGAFNGTAWLVNQPDGLIYVGSIAYLVKGTLPMGTDLIIREGTKRIGSSCFAGCEGLKSIYLPETVIAIGPEAFNGCTGLASIYLPNAITELPTSIFRDCSNLIEIVLPSSVTLIGNGAFANCSSLKSIIMSDSVTTIEYGAFYRCISLESIHLPATVVEIGNQAFYGCTSLQSCNIPPMVTFVPSQIFQGCTSLTSVSLPDAAITIGGAAFGQCTNLAAITLPKSLRIIYSNAFADCTHLTTIKLPASMYQIGAGAFRDCTALHEILCLAEIPPIAAEHFSYEEYMEEYESPGSFDGIDKDNCVVRVFDSVMDDYRAATGWREFHSFEALNNTDYLPGDTNGDGIVDIADVNGVINAMLGKASLIVDANDAKLGMTPVKGGTFMMGIDMEVYDGFPVTPVHQVTLDDYIISTTEVTQRFYNAVMGLSAPAAADALKPIYGLSWYDCQSFIQRLNDITGLEFRLPTEAEWEFAARGGNKSNGYGFSGSNNFHEVGWCDGYNGESPNPYPVAMLKPNELGIYDMTGNVWEWCQDWYAEYTADPQTNPTGPETGTTRVLRGGSCYEYYAEHCSVYDRVATNPTNHSIGDEPVGIRLAMDLDETLYNKACDVTGDGIVDISDVNAVINIMLGKGYDVPTGHQGHDTAPGGKDN